MEFSIVQPLERELLARLIKDLQVNSIEFKLHRCEFNEDINAYDSIRVIVPSWNQTEA